jgi:hypothetical protein
LDGGSGQHNRLLRHGETRLGTIREAGSELPSGCGDLLLVAASSFPAQEPGAGRGREVPDGRGQGQHRMQSSAAIGRMRFDGSTAARRGGGSDEQRRGGCGCGARARASAAAGRGGGSVRAREIGDLGIWDFSTY